MGRSQETFSKKENEKKRAKKKQDKADKMKERKANVVKGKSLEDMMAYIDENGNISATPPDPKKVRKISHEDIQIGIPQREDVAESNEPHKGILTNFNESKGYGFIKDMQTQQDIFVHISNFTEALKENDKVTFSLERSAKGMRAINVSKIQ